MIFRFSFKGVSLAVLATVLLAASNPAANAAPPLGPQLIRLSSGRQVKLISLGPATFGKYKALVLKYATDFKITDKPEISKECDDIWDLLKVDAEQGKYDRAVITACSEPVSDGTATGIKYNQILNFPLVKGPTGAWRCLNDQTVTVGTPAKAQYKKALDLARNGQYKEALAGYEKALELDKSYAPAYVDRGGIYLILNQLDKALADFNKALTLSPESADAYSNRGVAYWRLDKVQNAVEDFSKAISLNPAAADALANRGAVYVNLGEYEKAIDDLSKAIKIHAKPAAALYNRSIAMEKLYQIDRKRANELGYRVSKNAVTVH